MKEEQELAKQVNSSRDEVEIDLYDLFCYLRSKWLILIAALLVGSCFAYAITFFLVTPTYKATSYVYMVSASSGSVIDLSDLNIGTSVATDYEKLLTGRSVLENVASAVGDIKVSKTEKPKVGTLLVQDISELADYITITKLGDSHILDISVVTPYPEVSNKIANEIAKQAISHIPKVMNVKAPTIAEYAVVPENRYAPSYSKNTAIGGLLCMALVCAIYIVLYLMDDSIKTSEDVKKYFGVVPFTEIPEGKIAYVASHEHGETKENEKKNTLTFSCFPQLPYAVEEALNRLRVNVTFCSRDVKKILVISSTPDEGKSFVAVQLWRMLAESGIKTILVDADLRKSNLYKRYQFTSTSEICGISYYLSGQTTLEESVYHTNIENGDILPLTKNIMNPAMLLESKLFSEMLDQLAEQYRYVIIDSPPLGAVADGERIASLSDGALMTIHSGVTSRTLVRNSLTQLERAGCPLLGVVLNYVNAKSSGYYSKYGKYSFGYYGAEEKRKGKLKKNVVHQK